MNTHQTRCAVHRPRARSDPDEGDAASNRGPPTFRRLFRDVSNGKPKSLLMYSLSHLAT